MEAALQESKKLKYEIEMLVKDHAKLKQWCDELIAEAENIKHLSRFSDSAELVGQQVFELNIIGEDPFSYAPRDTSSAEAMDIDILPGLPVCESPPSMENSGEASPPNDEQFKRQTSSVATSVAARPRRKCRVDNYNYKQPPLKTKLVNLT